MNRPSAEHPQKAEKIIAWVKEQIRAFEERQQEMHSLESVDTLPNFTIDLSHMEIDVLPDEVIDILRERLERLALGHNRLRDVPQSIAMCSRLRYLNIRYNRLRTFPEPILDMPSLEILDISRNELSVLPESISKLQSLVVLAIAKNKIHQLPRALGSMEKLRILKLHGNPLDFLTTDAVDEALEVAGTPQSFTESEREIHQTTAIKKYLQSLQYDDTCRNLSSLTPILYKGCTC
jgi:Leucine-rich repeat (LRR) protein